MSIVLYEITDSKVSTYGSKYVANYSPLHEKVLISHWKLVMDSERIWRKTGDDIRYIKHLYEDITSAAVDPVEFTFLLLKSAPI